MKTLQGNEKFRKWYEEKYLNEIKDWIAPTWLLFTSELYPFAGLYGFILEYLREVEGIAIEWQSMRDKRFNFCIWEYIATGRPVFVWSNDNPDFNTGLLEAINKVMENEKQ